eukprot:c19407_g1_i1.p1 GENE.c19407_g1_i1~~c19407_g1_i1.p1  ORF type:complete len:409 (+),score=97.81 c19407_g1_i1:148-1374(+)
MSSNNTESEMLIPPMDFVIAQGALMGWDYQDVGFYCGLFLGPFLLLVVLAIYQFVRGTPCKKPIDSKTTNNNDPSTIQNNRNRKCIIACGVVVVLVSGLRVVHILLGPFHTHTLLARDRAMSMAVVEGVYAYGGVLVQALFCVVAGMMIAVLGSLIGAEGNGHDESSTNLSLLSRFRLTAVVGMLRVAVFSLGGLTLFINFVGEMMVMADNRRYFEHIKVVARFGVFATFFVPLCLGFVTVCLQVRLLQTTNNSNGKGDSSSSSDTSVSEKTNSEEDLNSTTKTNERKTPTPNLYCEVRRGAWLLVVSGLTLCVYHGIEVANLESLKGSMDGRLFRVGEYAGRLAEVMVCGSVLYALWAMQRVLLRVRIDILETTNMPEAKGDDEMADDAGDIEMNLKGSSTSARWRN